MEGLILSAWYTSDPVYDTVLAYALGFAMLVVVSAPFVESPYGRFSNQSLGMALHPSVGWLLMELPATVSFIYFYVSGPRRTEMVPLIFGGAWLVHYANRGFYFPLSLRVAKGAKSSFGILVVTAGWLVTSLHGYLHATFYTALGEHLTNDWLQDPRFIVGFSIYELSLVLTIYHEKIMRELRTKDEISSGKSVYRIPRGGLYEFVTSPCYLTELTGWAALACATWSLAGVFIFVVSAGNLVPRALSTHRWYKSKFRDEYPSNRTALVPFIL